MNKNRIEELRKQKNISVDELAQKLCISRTTLYNYESGKYAIPSNILLELRDLFEVSIDYILCKEPIDNCISLNIDQVDELLDDVKRIFLRNHNIK